MKLGISIVSMNRPDILRQTFERLDASAFAHTPIVVVDNGSTDEDTLTLLASRRATVIRNATNIGLSRAVNQGLNALKLLGCDLLMHLDDDALLGALDVSAFERNPELGLLIPNAFHYGEFIAHTDYHELRWALGYCWILRREVYDVIGGYDPQLLHQQECDFALRVRMAGYTVGAVRGFDAAHNDPGDAPRSALSLAREHLGCVQFRDKWCQYHRGRTCSYGSVPLYLMQHFPPDQEWYRRFALSYGFDFNPPPHDAPETSPGSVIGLTPETAEKIDSLRRIKIGNNWYMLYVDVRNDYAHWERGDGYMVDRQKAIDRWFELTGEKYEMYRWPEELLKCS